MCRRCQDGYQRNEKGLCVKIKIEGCALEDSFTK